MANAPLRHFLSRLRHWAGGAHSGNRTDRQLLEMYAQQHDDDAFAALVQRHGPLIQGVCRRVLGNRADADDVFQATFIVLARKAGSLAWHDSVAPWLHAVAYRLANKARGERARRRIVESQAVPRRSVDPQHEASWRELREVIDAELHALSSRYRAPLLLCVLEGLTRDEAARQLNWSLGTLKRRLERGRELLRARLARRGLTLGAPLAATLLAESTASALPAAMLQAAIVTVREAARGGVLAPRVAALVQHMLRSLAFDKAKRVVAVIVALAIATTGTFVGYRLVAGDGGIDNSALAGVEQPRGQRQRPRGERRRPVPDPTGVPLPEGALLRIRQDQPNPNVFAFTPDGRRLAVAHADGTIRLWDTTTGKETLRFRGGGVPQFVAFSADGKRLLAGREPLEGKPITIWNAATGERLRQATGLPRERVWALSPDGKTLAVAEDDKDPRMSPQRQRRTIGTPPHLQWWDLETGKQVARSDKVHLAQVTGLTFSPDGKTTASMDAGSFLCLWETATGKELWRAECTVDTSYLPPAFSSGGETVWAVLSAGRDQPRFSLQSFDVATGRPGERIRPLGYDVPKGVAFSPEDDLVATLDLSRTIHIWDLVANRKLGQTRKEQEWIVRVAFTRDGQTLATGGSNGTILVWDVAALPLGPEE